MVDLFNAEIIVAYQKVYADTIKLTSKHTINEFLSEINTERAKLADVLVSKHQVMTKEYQETGKSFKSKHEQVKSDEETKRLQIISNFENHFSGIIT